MEWGEQSIKSLPNWAEQGGALITWDPGHFGVDAGHRESVKQQRPNQGCAGSVSWSTSAPCTYNFTYEQLHMEKSNLKLDIAPYRIQPKVTYYKDYKTK